MLDVDPEQHAVALGRSDHLFGVLQGHRHGFFHEHVLAAAQGGPRVGEVQMIGRPDVNQIDRLMGAQPFDVRIGFHPGDILPEAAQDGLVAVGRRHQPEVRAALEARQHIHGGAAEAEDSQPQGRPAFNGVHGVLPPCALRITA